MGNDHLRTCKFLCVFGVRRRQCQLVSEQKHLNTHNKSSHSFDQKQYIGVDQYSWPQNDMDNFSHLVGHNHLWWLSNGHSMFGPFDQPTCIFASFPLGARDGLGVPAVRFSRCQLSSVLMPKAGQKRRLSRTHSTGRCGRLDSWHQSSQPLVPRSIMVGDGLPRISSNLWN